MAKWCQKSVLIDIPKFVKTPEGNIPCFVRFEAAKQRHDLTWDVLTKRTPRPVLPVFLGVAEREVSEFGWGLSISNIGGVDCLVEDRTQVIESVSRDIGKVFGDRLSQLQLVQLCGAIAVEFNDANVWVAFDESYRGGFEFGGVLRY
jgi:hypothetical protein